MPPLSHRPLPERIYEPNIIHSPFDWMGIWTPQGWRVHRKRWGRAERIPIALSGDGHTTFFPDALRDPHTGRVEWQDDLHLTDDPFTDAGIYPSDPRVEHPVGRPRWAVSHTLLCHPVADHGLYTHEYTWDLTRGSLQTHFRRHVALEEARTDPDLGTTVRVRHAPLSRTIEGNVQYPLPNSAVRGVWVHPDRGGANLYTRRVVQLIDMFNGVYARAPRAPVVQCHGVYRVRPDDPVDGSVFDSHTGDCRDRERLTEAFHIPLDEPKIGRLPLPVRGVPSRVYGADIGMLTADEGVVDERHLERLQARLGSRFETGHVGYARDLAAGSDARGYEGYAPAYDLNSDGLIDAEDAERLRRHLGRRVRYNLYVDAYFGGDWLSTSVCLDAEHRPGARVIADYEYGGGYDADSATIRLLQSPGPDEPVWVEYHYDAPAEPGENNIRVHLYRELD